MAQDAKGNELKVGDKVQLQAEVIHVHPELVTVQVVAPAGHYSAPLTIHGKCVASAGPDPLGPDGKQENNHGSDKPNP